MDHQAAIDLLQTGDSFLLAEKIESDSSPDEVGKKYLQLALDLYWKAKNLRATVLISQMGIHYCLSKARDAATAIDVRASLLDLAKKMAYNLASFCWSGWDEPGIVIRESEIEAGADAAKLNLRLAKELNRPPLGMSMAHWLLGGYALATKQFETAAAEFQQAADLAKQAGNEGQVLLNRGLRALSQIGEKQATGTIEFDGVMKSLDTIGTDDSKEFARQLFVARKVFGL